MPQPIGGIDDVRPGWVGPLQIGLELGCQPRQLVRPDAVHHALLRPLPLLLRRGLSTSPLPFPATVFGCDYGILVRIRGWFVVVLVGSVFRLLGGGIY